MAIQKTFGLALKIAVFGLVLVFSNVFAQNAQNQKLAEVRLSGPGAFLSLPLIYMAESGALNDIAEKTTFQLWKNPDQLRLFVLDQKTDFIALPSNVAANLYNRGVPLKLVNIAAWGGLWLVSRRENVAHLADLKNEEIAIPFRGDMPDILFELNAAKENLNVQKDFKIRYLANIFDALQLLILRQVDHALLPEPAASMALEKSQSLPVSVIAPKLYKALRFETLLKENFNNQKLPQAGIAAVNHAAQNFALQNRIYAEYQKALAFCEENAATCAKMMMKYAPMLSTNVVVESLKSRDLNPQKTADVASDLKEFFLLLNQQNPKLIGGKMPDDSFFE